MGRAAGHRGKLPAPRGSETETSARALSHSHSRFPGRSLPLPAALFLESLSRPPLLVLRRVAGSEVGLEYGLFWTRTLQGGALDAKPGRKPCPVLGLMGKAAWCLSPGARQGPPPAAAGDTAVWWLCARRLRALRRLRGGHLVLAGVREGG